LKFMQTACSATPSIQFTNAASPPAASPWPTPELPLFCERRSLLSFSPRNTRIHANGLNFNETGSALFLLFNFQLKDAKRPFYQLSTFRRHHITIPPSTHRVWPVI